MGDSEDNRFERLGSAIRAKREAAGLSQRALAQMIGQESSNSYIFRVERGKVKIGLEQLIAIADALGVKVSDLVDF